MTRSAPSAEITDPIIVRELIAELAADRADGIIRPLEERKLGVRFSFGESFLLANPPAFMLSKISDLGRQRLQRHSEIFVEVLDIDARIAFNCTVLQHTAEGLLVRLPLSLSKAERRGAQRYKATELRLPFVKAESWKFDEQDIAAPPLFGLYQPLSTWAPVYDISFGGLCLETRFPSLLKHLEAKGHGTHAQLILPMLPPIPTGLDLRWTKRIRERTSAASGTHSFQKYRMGLAFLNPTRELMLAVGRYIKELHMDSAV